MKNEKNYMGFLITKIWQILKRFSRALKVESKPLISEECVSKYMVSINMETNIVAH